MVAVPFSILALAAGVALLIKVKKENSGTLPNLLSWLVILLSLGFMLCLGMMEWRKGHHHNKEGREKCMNDERGNKGNGSKCCSNDSTMNMPGCHMEHDSVVMDKDACEKMMGKEACEKMCKERGRCVMSKDECSKMCAPKGGCCKEDEDENGEGCHGRYGHGNGCCGGDHDGCGHRGGCSCCSGGGCGSGGCGTKDDGGCSGHKDGCGGMKDDDGPKGGCCKHKEEKEVVKK